MTKKDDLEILDALSEDKEVRLGYCPNCRSPSYERGSIEVEEDFCSCYCECQKCNHLFKEYFGLDEIKYGDSYYSDKFRQKELDLIKEVFEKIDDKKNKEIIRRILRIARGKTNESY